MKMNEYETQANDFLTKTNTTIDIEFLKYDYHFEGEKEKRDIYNVTIKRGQRQFSFNFGNSLNDSGLKVLVGGMRNREINITDKLTPLDTKQLREGKKLMKGGSLFGLSRYIDFNIASCDKVVYPVKPSNYSILACLTKYDPCTLENFCSELGYDEDSKTAEKIYNAVCKEWLNVCLIWNDDELELLREIQ